MINILIIDDDEIFGETLVEELNDSPDYSATYISGPKSIEVSVKPDYIFLDLKIQNLSGLNFIEPIKQKYPESKVYIITGYGSIATAVSAMKHGAEDYLTKPITIQKIDNIISGSYISEVDLSEEPLSLDRVEREYIEHILDKENGNISRAAQKLGLHRQSLQRKLKKDIPKK